MSTQYDCSAPLPTRPLSWCNWLRPNRSAFSIIITEAFGTFTPTSITVVETKKKAGKEPDEQTARYMSKLAEVRSIRSAISTATRDLDAARETYSIAEGEEKTKIASSLEEGEMKIAALRMDLDKASRGLRDIEMDFLLNGVEINIDDFTESGEESDSGEKFRFVRREFGDPYIVVWNTQN